MGEIEKKHIDDDIEIIDNTKIVQKNDLLNLIQQSIESNNAQKKRLNDLIEDLTQQGSFSDITSINFKGPTVVGLLTELGKTTDRFTNLLSVIQKFNSDKVSSENTDKLINSIDRVNVLNILDELNIGPKRIVDLQNKKQTNKVDLLEKQTTEIIKDNIDITNILNVNTSVEEDDKDEDEE